MMIRLVRGASLVCVATMILTLVFSTNPVHAAPPPEPQTPALAPDALRKALAAALTGVTITTADSDDYSDYTASSSYTPSYKTAIQYHSTVYPTNPQPLNQQIINAASGYDKTKPFKGAAAKSPSGSGTVKASTALPGAPKVDINVLAAALIQSYQAENYALGVLNNVNNGNWNQFTGQPTYPDPWYSNFRDPTYAGAGFSASPVSATPQAVLGLASSPSRSYAPPFLTRLSNVLYAPWTSATLQPQNQLEARYQALEQHQLQRYYTDPDLSNMRIELNRGLLFYPYTDPFYLYWSYELNTTLDTIRSSRPSYTSLQQLTTDINSWTTPPTDDAVLRERYVKRLLLPYLQARVELDTASFIAANPQLAAQIITVRNFLQSRLALEWAQPTALVWYADWQQRWSTYYFGSPAAAQETQETQQIVSAYPAFQEYTDLNSEVVDLLPSLNDYAAVQRVATLSAQVQTSQDVATAINQQYDTYKSHIQTILAQSAVPTELETYYERLNGLVNNDATYQQLKLVQSLAVVRIQEQQRRVHDAVLLCYQASGALCNPYLDVSVFNELYGTNNLNLISALGQFYEVSNRFWYTTYASTAYQTLEQDTRSRVNTALTPVLPAIEAARQAFKTNVNALPLVRELQQARSDLVQGLHGTANHTTSLPIADPSPEIRKRLDRMAVLAAQLNRSDITAQAAGSRHVYLPMLHR